MLWRDSGDPQVLLMAVSYPWQCSGQVAPATLKPSEALEKVQLNSGWVVVESRDVMGVDRITRWYRRLGD